MKKMRGWEEEDAFYKVQASEIFSIQLKLYNNSLISFEEFLKLVNAGVELEFYYNKRHLGIIPYDKLAIFEWNKEWDFGVSKDIVEFKNFAKIGKLSLKTCFSKLKSIQVF